MSAPNEDIGMLENNVSSTNKRKNSAMQKNSLNDKTNPSTNNNPTVPISHHNQQIGNNPSLTKNHEQNLSLRFEKIPPQSMPSKWQRKMATLHKYPPTRTRNGYYIHGGSTYKTKY